MKIIVGLGNPGKEYETSRHNTGFMVVDEVSKQLTENSKQWKQEKKMLSVVCSLLSDNAILVKPQTFMNNSGQAVRLIAKSYNLRPEDLWVVHDDLDLELGRIKIHAGGTSGHHGIDSIIKEIGMQDFLKFRLGIGRPKNQEDIDFLLSPFTKEELIAVTPAIKQMAKAVIMALEQGVDRAMNEFNR
ncbi:MAG: aminoacyl-tRNA hydrolase [Patescibacteria group bacterium]|nr:aminoacyl-tRNA hydrolase [Patescibacteria group bacterium]